MLLYFIRHGQTDWNAARRLQGHLDIPINALGQSQARRNGALLRELVGQQNDFHFTASPLLRTRQTMELIRTAMGHPAHEYQTDERIREIAFGDWSGKTMEEVQATDPHQYARRKADPWNYGPPNGECWRDFYCRVMDWIKSISGNNIVVGHGGVSRCLRKYYLDLTIEETVHLDVPQDKIMMVQDGAITWL